MIRVVFFPVRDNKEKLKKLVEQVAFHFERKESIILFTEDEKAAHYVDELLWKSPSTSFLPHVLTEGDTSEYVAINFSRKNVNQAKYAFNLCPTPLLIEGSFKIIYDFEDLSSPSKQQFSTLRFDAYKKDGYLIEARAP